MFFFLFIACCVLLFLQSRSVCSAVGALAFDWTDAHHFLIFSNLVERSAAACVLLPSYRSAGSAWW